MTEYISTFATGFGEIIPAAVKKLLPGVHILWVYDGLVGYRYGGREEDIGRVFLFNNTFLVIRRFEGRSCELEKMLRSVATLQSLPRSKGTFRIRYSVNNRFVSVPQERTRQLENRISTLTHARVDRVSPDTEYWFLKRSEGIGFFCRQTGRRKATEKNLHPGELRPEFAFLMCSLASLESASVVMDPFSGYGAIPNQVARNFRFARMYASDLDRDRVVGLKKRFGQQKRVVVSERDALQLDDIPEHSVDAIITDPPWGFYEEIGDIRAFYDRMFKSFRRVLSGKGVMVILSARKGEIEAAAAANEIIQMKRFDTLVNGKKAGVYVFACEPPR